MCKNTSDKCINVLIMHSTHARSEQRLNMQLKILITQFYSKVYLLKYYIDLFSFMMCISVNKYYVV